MFNVTVRPVEIDGAFWVETTMGDKTTRRPAASADEAEIMAVRAAAVCRALNWQVRFDAPAVRGR